MVHLTIHGRSDSEASVPDGALPARVDTDASVRIQRAREVASDFDDPVADGSEGQPPPNPTPYRGTDTDDATLESAGEMPRRRLDERRARPSFHRCRCAVFGAHPPT